MVLPMTSDGGKPERLTWDGKLDQNMAFINQIVGLLAIVSETAPQLLGLEQWGGDLSGRALKILLLRKYRRLLVMQSRLRRLVPTYWLSLRVSSLF